MNAVLAHIYGTNGLEKTAGEATLPSNLSELAISLVYDEAEHGQDLTKVAAAQKPVFEQLCSYDRAGRALAQAEFSELEKQASEGNVEMLQAFLADVVEQPDPQEVERQQALDAVRQELARRGVK